MNLVRSSLIVAGACAALGATLPGHAQDAQEAQRVLAFAQSGDGARVLLYMKPGPCVGLARFAEHVTPGGDKTPGCWVMGEGLVLVSFLDGERGNIPVAHLKRAEML